MSIDDAWILTLNAGSSSLKFSAYDLDTTKKIAAGQIASIGANSTLNINGESEQVDAADYAHAVQIGVQRLMSVTGLKNPPTVAGHRVVHGGARSAAAIITEAVRADIEASATMAPLHNPPALAALDAAQSLFPDIPQAACFDTAFHADNPIEATTIPLPKTIRDKGVRRYGFHGLSYASIVRNFSSVTKTDLPKRTLAFHLGAGASLAAIFDGKGVATTMGFSPLDGLVMATRAGAMDAGVLLYLMRNEGLDVDRLDHILNKESGLKALSGGETDMRTLLQSDTPEAKFAVSHYCYWVSRHAGSMIAAMGGVDGFVFTGGIGENSDFIRRNIIERLEWVGKTPFWIIPADEEGEIAHETRELFLQK